MKKTDDKRLAKREAALLRLLDPKSTSADQARIKKELAVIRLQRTLRHMP